MDPLGEETQGGATRKARSCGLRPQSHTNEAEAAGAWAKVVWEGRENACRPWQAEARAEKFKGPNGGDGRGTRGGMVGWGWGTEGSGLIFRTFLDDTSTALEMFWKGVRLLQFGAAGYYCGQFAGLRGRFGGTNCRMQVPRGDWCGQGRLIHLDASFLSSPLLQPVSGDSERQGWLEITCESRLLNSPAPLVPFCFETSGVHFTMLSSLTHTPLSPSLDQHFRISAPQLQWQGVHSDL